MFRLVLAGGLLFGGEFAVSAAPASGATADTPETQQALALVRQLGSNSYRVREQATKQLIQLGRIAKPALLQGLNDPDPEVADRCRRILPLAREADLKARIDAFLQDKDNAQKHDLPGWVKFQKLVGADAASRTIYVEMLQTNAALLEVAEEEPRLLTDKYLLRLQEMQQQLHGPSSGPRPPLRLADVTTILFLGTYVDESKMVNGNNAQSIVANFFYQPVFRNGLTNNQNEPLRRLFLAWLETRTDANAIHQGMTLAIQCDIKGALPVATKLLKSKEAQPHGKAMAMLAIGKLGAKEQVAELEPLLTDEANLGNFQFNNVMGNTQLRDVALAMSIHLAGQQPREYGFDMLQQQPLNFNYYYNLGFSSNEKRDAARQKWKDWLAKQK